MMSQTRKQIIITQMFPNISSSNGNQAMKLGQLEFNNVRNISLKSHLENEAGRLLPDLFLFFKKTLYKIKANDQHLSFNEF